MGFDAIARAETLSHQSLGGEERKIPRSFNTYQSHESLAAMEANALYSDSIEDIKTVSCFLALQVMGL